MQGAKGRRTIMIAKTLQALSLAVSISTAYAISLKDHYPQNYVVEENDTLYGIAGKYLNKPWEWKKLWRANPKLKNPRKLYPGMVLKLEYIDGKPILKKFRGGIYKLSPHARARPAQKPIPPIPLSEIKPFLNGSRVLDGNELQCAPYVVDFVGEHLRGAQNNEAYVQDLTILAGKNPRLGYSVFRPDGKYKDPEDPKKILGYKATYIADAQLMKEGQPATVVFTSIQKGVQIKDRLFPSDEIYPFYFEPKAPNDEITARVIDFLGAIDQAAQNQILVIDKGKKQGLEQGDVLGIFKPAKLIPDPLHRGKTVRIPRERVADAMIFRTFTNVSYALIVSSSRPVYLMDIATNP